MDDPRFDSTDDFAPSSPLPELLPRRRTPWNTVGGRVISVVSRKGGVGKTTSTVNLGAALALSGHSVLIIGLDPQCGVCRTLGLRPHELPRCLDELWTARARLADLAQSSTVENLFFAAPRILTLAEEERFLEHLQDRGGELVREVDRARSLYDTILLDCPPGLGAPTRAALLASDGYLVPVQNEELCRESLDALLEFIDTFRDRNFAGAAADDSEQSAPLQLEGLFLTMSAQGTRVGREVAARIQDDFGDLLFDTAIPRTVRLAEMAQKGQPAVIYDRRSAGSRAYFDLADELVARYCVDQSAGQRGEAVDAGGNAGGDDLDRPAARFAAGGLERFLAALAGGDEPESAESPFGEPTLGERSFGDRLFGDQGGDLPLEAFGGPEMVSLDDLLDEEERRTGGEDDWSGDDWSFDSDRLN